jgi:hypothetical protein
MSLVEVAPVELVESRILIIRAQKNFTGFGFGSLVSG